MKFPQDNDRTVIASEAKQSIEQQESADCFVASLLADLRCEHRATDQSALLQLDQRLIGFGKRHRRHRYRADLLGAHEIEQLLGFPQISDIAALDRDRLDR